MSAQKICRVFADRFAELCDQIGVADGPEDTVVTAVQHMIHSGLPSAVLWRLEEFADEWLELMADTLVDVARNRILSLAPAGRASAEDIVQASEAIKSRLKLASESTTTSDEEVQYGVQVL